MDPVFPGEDSSTALDELPEYERQQVEDMPQWMIDQTPTEEEIAARDHESPISRGALVSMLTPPAKVRIIQTLITKEGDAVMPKEVCDHATVSRDVWNDCIDELLMFGVVEETDAEQGSPLYRVDLDDPTVEALLTVLDVGAQRRARATIEEN
jgi:hypothetical protein